MEQLLFAVHVDATLDLVHAPIEATSPVHFIRVVVRCEGADLLPRSFLVNKLGEKKQVWADEFTTSFSHLE